MTLRHRATITWASPPTFQSLVLAVALGIFCTEFASANFEHLPTPLGPDSLSEAVMHEQIRLHMRSAQPSNARSLWRGCGERLSHLTEVRTEERKQSDSGRNGGTDKDLLRQRAFYERDVELCWETWRGGIPDGHLVEVSVAGETVELDYDEFGRLVTLTRLDTRTNEQPRITHYRYGPARTVEIDGPREDVADLLWLALDDDWQVLESTNALGQRFLFEYDEQR